MLPRGIINLEEGVDSYENFNKIINWCRCGSSNRNCNSSRRFASNRWKIKKFVSDKFDGNETLLGVVDNLSDTDINNVMNVVKKVKKGKKQVSVYGNNVKETTETVKEKLQDLVTSVF